MGRDDEEVRKLKYWLDIALRYFMAGVLGYIGYDWQTLKSDVRILRESRESVSEKLEGTIGRLDRIEHLLDRNYRSLGDGTGG